MTAPAPAHPVEVEGPPPHRRLRIAVTGVEVMCASVAVALHLLIPTFILLAMAGVSLLIRREGWSSLGLRRPVATGLAAKMLAFAAAWSVFQLSVTMPIANHLSGKRQDLSDFKDLEGNAGMLIGLLVLSWTLAAVGEELAYRGYLQTRMGQLFGGRRGGLVAAVLCPLSSSAWPTRPRASSVLSS